MIGIAGILLTLTLLGAEPPAAPLVEDIFGRRLNEHGLVLVDWEGHMANPAIRFFVQPAADAVLPVKAVLKAKEPRLYFDLPSGTGADGPRKELRFESRAKAAVSLAIFPDRDALDEHHALDLELVDAKGHRQALSLPIHVIDQDPTDRTPIFPIILDFSKDRTGFFHDEAKRSVLLQAASDWAYFFDEMHLTATPAKDEQTFLWDPDGFKTGRYIMNEKEYTGFLLYVYGIEGELLRSGGEPSRAGGFLTAGETRLPLRRSGGVEVEVQGNYNKHGWRVDLDDANWWKATNPINVPNDLYSIAHHEIGHALIFNAGHTWFAAAKLLGSIRDSGVKSYLGTNPSIDKTDHLNGTVDPESLRGAFGNEYHGKVPRGRWLITKTDLLCARAVGYSLRETTAFAPLKLTTAKLPEGSVAARYSALLHASGGIPFHNWEVVEGGLPDGLELDPFSGEIRGIPKRAGAFTITVRVRGYDEKATGISRMLRININ